ncbi:choice-of-anchor tandem repeat GloVer-containing protein [Methylocystis echinoides]|uniref:Uncharacterized protein n=1 Tax=Methylocystis echinoides TaxID=29468 RepID=A0A9W6LSB4_9HYPH|nr:choice-of-anchor tandem repeat GloVer-containing protein [Methylocystis echinoides]GLI93322.1 hypothetical protein LMG27198_23140 [Methylocystis echinoides]
MNGVYSELILAELPSQYSPSAGFTNVAFNGEGRGYVATATGGVNNAGQIFGFWSDIGRAVQQQGFPSAPMRAQWDLPSFARAPSSIVLAPGGKLLLTNANGVSLFIVPSAMSGNWSGSQILAIQNCLGVTVDPVTDYIYGATSSGGANGKGELFKLSRGGPTGYTKTTLYSFTAYDGTPSSRPTLGPNGAIYGVTRNGGYNAFGSVYVVQPFSATIYNTSYIAGYQLTTLAMFSGYDGAAPISPPLLDSYGAVYGTTSAGGPSNKGVVYKVDKAPYPNAQRMKYTLYTFGSSASDGVAPTAPLIFSGDGGLIGTNVGGDATNGGSVFKVNP